MTHKKWGGDLFSIEFNVKFWKYSDKPVPLPENCQGKGISSKRELIFNLDSNRFWYLQHSLE